jgi:hypothetical protein
MKETNKDEEKAPIFIHDPLVVRRESREDLTPYA